MALFHFGQLLEQLVDHWIIIAISACIPFCFKSVRAWVRGRYDRFGEDWESTARVVVQNPTLRVAVQANTSRGHTLGMISILGGVVEFLIPSHFPWFMNGLGLSLIGMGLFSISFAKFQMDCNQKAWMWVASRKRRAEDRED